MIFQDNTGKRWRIVKVIFGIYLFKFTLLISLVMLHWYEVIDFPGLNEFIMQLYNFIKSVFIAYLFFAIVVGFLRMFIILIFCFRQKRKNKIFIEYRTFNKSYFKTVKPSVSVIIPVYNEEVVIRRTIRSILKSEYPITEILIIDDGSTDKTTAIATKMSHLFSKVKIIKKHNGGKASALNSGIQNALGDIIITIDADTVFKKSTISYLVENFLDPRVAAVSGNCIVGNRINQISLWQHIEYVTANQLEKRAFEELNCITVVPGSNSAWRKSVVQELGYYHNDTLAEDSELTLRILNAGYKINFEDRAVSYEECPETVRDFIKQRCRWSYGVLQVAWKHKRNIVRSSNKTLKYFAVPSLLFSYLLLLTSPVIDVIFIVAILSRTSSIYFFVLLFYITDFLNSFIAFKIGNEKMKPLVWILFQRIGYRYLLSYVTWTSIIRALKGNHVGWRKLNRSGNNVYKV